MHPDHWFEVLQVSQQHQGVWKVQLVFLIVRWVFTVYAQSLTWRIITVPWVVQSVISLLPIKVRWLRIKSPPSPRIHLQGIRRYLFFLQGVSQPRVIVTWAISPSFSFHLHFSQSHNPPTLCLPWTSQGQHITFLKTGDRLTWVSSIDFHDQHFHFSFSSLLNSSSIRNSRCLTAASLPPTSVDCL